MEPARTDFQYFSRDEKKDLDKFLAILPEPCKVYTNPKGETRTCRRVFLPFGTVIDGLTQDLGPTAFDQQGNPSRYSFYHTPGAVIEGVVGKVNYELPDGSQAQCDSNEWVKWIGGDVKKVVVKDEPIPEAEKPTEIPAHVLKASKEKKAVFDKAAAAEKERVLNEPIKSDD